MRKIIVLLMLAALAAPSVLAQVTEGEPSSKTIRTGNRPKEGYFGVYMGITSDAVSGWADKSLNVTALPIVNLKYMATDQFEVRLGIETYSKTQQFNGEEVLDAASGSYRNRSFSKTDAKYLLYPGVAYHFSKKNIFDVYVGGELPIGCITGDYNGQSNTVSVLGNTSESFKSNRFQVGLGAFLGFQCFIADLPLALGLEYGISYSMQFGDKVCHTATDANGKSTVRYTTAQSLDTQFSNLSASKSVLGNQLRLTLSYYFK